MAFNRNQKRDRRGRWTSGGGSKSSSAKTKRNQRNNRRKLAAGSIGVGAGVGYLIAGPVGALAGAGIVGANNIRYARKLRKNRG